MRFRDHADIHFLLQRTQSVRTKSAQTDDQGRASRGADKFAFFHDASAGADQQRVVHGLSRVSGGQKPASESKPLADRIRVIWEYTSHFSGHGRNAREVLIKKDT